MSPKLRVDPPGLFELPSRAPFDFIVQGSDINVLQRSVYTLNARGDHVRINHKNVSLSIRKYH
jgi:hypothetical protein